MEIKQEVNDETCQAEIYYNNDGRLDICKIEIKEEPLEESVHDTFENAALKKLPIMTEIEQEEHELTSFKERETHPGGKY
ncbi:unnamed protein product [Diabrotica balteata]|uniref:Uncharacterized protein n=1 Tax=Diabrotica balteata TaxID=107213 RepID=A0A9N9SLB4_DIABA|nr:unnamed protein product [Diabrotica balteata]